MFFVFIQPIPAFVLQTAPATVRISGPKTLITVRVLFTVLDLHFAQFLVRHHVHVVTLQIKQQVRPHARGGGDGDVRVLDPAVGRLHHRLLETSFRRAEEGYGEVPRGRGGDGRQ